MSVDGGIDLSTQVSKHPLIKNELTGAFTGVIIPPMLIERWLHRSALILFVALIMTSSASRPDDEFEQVRFYTRQIEFDYVTWTLSALQVKLGQVSLPAAEYLDDTHSHRVVIDYINLTAEMLNKEALLRDLYADPKIQDPASASIELRQELVQLRSKRRQLGPLAESIVQRQLSRVVAEMGLAVGGQPLPPLLYHSTPLPKALIVSPREEIRQDQHISILPDLTLEQQIGLEQSVDDGLNVSSLVVPVGGIGVYPTMVMQTSSLSWLAEVVAHEWIHNYLTLRPLGISYMSSPELRTMNETAASIAGVELGIAFIERYYPELLPPPAPVAPANPPPTAQKEEPPPFDFRAEMHITRVEVDSLLAAGQVEQAEAYMEQRRLFLWENGYHIRKLNQAYFAFYGAYADQPGGAAGEDPVGAAVRTLRSQSPDLASFIKRIAWMWSFQSLQKAVAAGS